MMERKGFLKKLAGLLGLGAVAPAAMVSGIVDAPKVSKAPVVTSGYLKVLNADTSVMSVATTTTASAEVNFIFRSGQYYDHNGEIVQTTFA